MMATVVPQPPPPPPTATMSTTNNGCQSCRELHADIKLSVAHITEKLDRFFFRVETLIARQFSANVATDQQSENGTENVTKSRSPRRHHHHHHRMCTFCHLLCIHLKVMTRCCKM
jgi:hypothetical protein